MVRSKREVWPHIDAAVVELCAGLNGPLLEQIAAIEDALDHNSIEQRALAGPASGLTIREFSDELARDFHDINAEWITAMFRLEPADLEVLEQPRARIVDPGGAILFLRAPGLGIIASVIMLGFGLWWLGRAESAARRAGEGYGGDGGIRADDAAADEVVRERTTVAHAN